MLIHLVKTFELFFYKNKTPQCFANHMTKIKQQQIIVLENTASNIDHTAAVISHL